MITHSCYRQCLFVGADKLVGGDNELAIVLGRYTPDQGNVQCSTNKKRFINGCRDILSGIPVSTEEELFGPLGNPDIDVLLPVSTQSRKFVSRPNATYDFLKTRI